MGLLETSQWLVAGRDIGWAEAVAIEIAVMWLTTSRLHDSSIKINCNNTSVINSFWKGRSHNLERNQSLICITSNLMVFKLNINLCYLPSAQNKDDSLSRSATGSDGLRLVPHVPIPEPLCPLLDAV